MNQMLLRTFSLFTAFAAVFFIPTASRAAGLSDDLARCRAVADAVPRLACYDALVQTPASAAVSVTVPAAMAVAPATAAAAVSPPAPPPAVAAINTPASFGFEAKLMQAAPEVLESRVLGRFEGWRANTQIRLENGQVWQVVDDSRAFIDQSDPKVRISRAAMGSFMFEVIGRNSAARVRRIE